MPSRPAIDYIERTKDLYSSLGHAPYQWVNHTDQPPWHTLKKPLSACKLGGRLGWDHRRGKLPFL